VDVFVGPHTLLTSLLGNRIKDILPLAVCARLRLLSLRDNALTDALTLPLLPTLTALDLSGNKLTSVVRVAVLWRSVCGLSLCAAVPGPFAASAVSAACAQQHRRRLDCGAAEQTVAGGSVHPYIAVGVHKLTAAAVFQVFDLRKNPFTASFYPSQAATEEPSLWDLSGLSAAPLAASGAAGSVSRRASRAGQLGCVGLRLPWRLR
jgi:hypothetical protein